MLRTEPQDGQQMARARTTTCDAPMGRSRQRSTVLTETEEAVVIEFRRRTLLPLDDVLGCLALRWRTPFQAICDAWRRDPSAFKITPHHPHPGKAQLA